jgi:DNA-directed RNA polymerase subunit RPC12/RpoP
VARERSVKKPRPIFEVIWKLNTEAKCIAHFESLRWPAGLRCIRCESKRVFRFIARGKTGKDRHLYECVNCHYHYSVTGGTVFHDSHLPVTK